MIQASELRIGNWFYYEHGDGRTGYGKIELGADIDLASTNHVYWNPIELTPDILIKCGFEYQYGLWEIEPLRQFWIIYNEYNKTFEIDINSEYPGNAIMEIKYLHQLQNLIFALTQTELNIQL